MRYFSHTEENLRSMLSVVKKNSLDELFSSIPESMRLSRPLDLPTKMDELALKQYLEPFHRRPAVKSFLGAGATAHFVPEWVSQQLLRAEWYTSYTPYQPEASQGTLQAIFEFQSMVASLFGQEIANASMYDGATSFVEAMLMAVRFTGKKTVLASITIHPEYRECAKTYFFAAGYEFKEIDFDETGHTSINNIKSFLKNENNDVAAIAIQSPNFFGRIEDFKKIADLAHAHEALAIGVITDMSCAGLLPALGDKGADIAVGEGLGLLGALNLGGPGLGLLAAKKSLLRQLPGRLVGETSDKAGRTGYVLTLSTREQHIRREKATSNICTNHNLMALAFTMALSAYGKSGFLKLGQTNVKKTLFLRRCLEKQGIRPAFLGPFYNETVIDLGKKLDEKLARLRNNGVIGGLPLKKFYPQQDGHLLISTTELHKDSDIKLLAKLLLE